MAEKQPEINDEEIAHRRDDVIRRMIAMPPTPHKSKMAASKNQKKREQPSKREKSVY
jgi:hypothetical protein